ncbi:MAG: hypothetical protein V2J55_15625 [Candidatus Competibacteraceae bacterium]|jgi:hypothetical protein|nr:hypothetical protein [Candidatus Competibacteraceae bacterium]
MKNRTAVVGVVLLAIGMVVDVGAQIPNQNANPNDPDAAAQSTAPVVDETSEQPAAQAPVPAQAPNQTPASAAAQVFTLTPGLYQAEESDVEFNEDDDGFNGTGVYKLQLDIKADGAFSLSGYVSAADAGLSDQPIFRIRGRWKQEKETLIASDMLEQFYDFQSNTFSPWEPPEDGQATDIIRIRNVTQDTFQEYDEDSGSWMTWSKL